MNIPVGTVGIYIPRETAGLQIPAWVKPLIGKRCVVVAKSSIQTELFPNSTHVKLKFDVLLDREYIFAKNSSFKFIEDIII